MNALQDDSRMETSAQSRYCSMAAPTFGKMGGVENSNKYSAAV